MTTIPLPELKLGHSFEGLLRRLNRALDVRAPVRKSTVLADRDSRLIIYALSASAVRLV